MKTIFFLIIMAIPFYCYANEKKYYYAPESYTYYQLDGQLYSDTIEEEVSGQYVIRQIEQGKEISSIQCTQNGTCYYIKNTYPQKNTKHVKIFYENKKPVYEFTLVNGFIEGKYIYYTASGSIGKIINFKKGKKEGIAEISNAGGNKWGEILFNNDEPISGFCYEPITHKKIKLSQITIQNILEGNTAYCGE
jgi:hypothetical protein